MTAKYGIPYFANFIDSELSPEDARSMCCRLRLDLRKLESRGGGLLHGIPYHFLVRATRGKQRRWIRLV